MEVKYAECMHIVLKKWNVEEEKGQKDNMQDFLVLWHHVKWNFLVSVQDVIKNHSISAYLCLKQNSMLLNITQKTTH